MLKSNTRGSGDRHRDGDGAGDAQHPEHGFLVTLHLQHFFRELVDLRAQRGIDLFNSGVCLIKARFLPVEAGAQVGKVNFQCFGVNTITSYLSHRIAFMAVAFDGNADEQVGPNVSCC